MDIKAVHEHIASRKEQNLEALEKIIRQPSVSAHNDGVRECARLLVDLLAEIGASGRICETKGQPAVFAELKSPNKDALTVLFYGHYDVQPPEPLDEWFSPPFEPTVRDGRLYGRGTADDKGQLIAHLLAVKSFLALDNGIPINAKFIFDGEEESGSPNLADFVENNREMLKADVVYASDGAMHDFKTPSVLLGHRGVMSFEVEIETAGRDNHSGNKGGVIKNAAWEMVRLLSTMIDKNDFVTIEGFYDDVMPVSSVNQALIDKLPFDKRAVAEAFSVSEIVYDKNEFYKRIMFLPTLTINGISSGYTGRGTKTIIPCRANAKFDVRLVIDQDGKKVFEKIKRHIEKECPGARVTYNSQMLPSYTSPEHPAIKAVIAAVRKVYETEPVITPLTGGSLPAYVWTKILGIPSIGVPYANPDSYNHSPNENLVIDNFYKGIHASAQVIYELSKL